MWAGGRVTEVTWRPHAGPQTAFLACPLYEVLYGGAAGGGKSDALLAVPLKRVHRPRLRDLIIRRSYPELRELIHRSLELYPAAVPGARYNRSEKTWLFPTGARVEFGYVSCDEDVYRYLGQEYTGILWDQVEQQTEWAYRYLMSRCRTTDPEIRPIIRATANPGGKGHGWVLSRFIESASPWQSVHDDDTGQDRVFIPATLDDNPALAATDYAQRLEALPDADKKALRHGDWYAYTGQVFRFERGVHVWSWQQFRDVTDHDRPPAEWTRFRVMDWGYARPYAIYWIAVDLAGRGYVYRERYGVRTDSRGVVQANEGVKLEPQMVAMAVAHIEEQAKERVDAAWTGPDVFARGRGDYGSGRPIAEYFTDAGVYWQPWDASSGSRVAAKMALHQRLAYQRGDGGEIREWPGLVFIGEECPHAIRTIPALEYDTHRVEDVATDGEDHAYDAIKAFCLMRPWAPTVTEKQPKWQAGGRPRSEYL
jgi:hypothetical protein